MNLEQTYSRAQAARAFNILGRWISNPNLTIIKGRGIAGESHYESGKPDGFAVVKRDNQIPLCYCIECKAAVGSLYMGNPDDKDDTSGWHYHQRSWYEHMAKPINWPYFIWLWTYPARELPSRVYHKDAFTYLVPAERWIVYSELIRPRKTIGLTKDLEREIAYKTMTVNDAFRDCKLEWSDGGFGIPMSHPFYRF